MHAEMTVNLLHSVPFSSWGRMGLSLASHTFRHARGEKERLVTLDRFCGRCQNVGDTNQIANNCIYVLVT